MDTDDYNVNTRKMLSYFLGGFTLVFIGITMLVFAFSYYGDYKELMNDHTITKGKVINKYIYMAFEGEEIIYVLQYTDNQGKIREIHNIVHSYPDERYNIGDEVEMVLSNKNPRLARINSYLEIKSPFIDAFCMATIFLGAGLVNFIMFFIARKEKKLIESLEED